MECHPPLFSDKKEMKTAIRGKKTAICRETNGTQIVKVNKMHRSSASFKGRIATSAKTEEGSFV